MTAVEFLLRELADNFQEEMQNLYSKNMQLVANICEQAKEMEKQQIIDATLHGFREDAESFDWKGDNYNAEEYYNETFNK
jgi:uncharacterized protein YjgD (DUF1641 family)